MYLRKININIKKEYAIRRIDSFWMRTIPSNPFFIFVVQPGLKTLNINCRHFKTPTLPKHSEFVHIKGPLN